MSLYVTTEKAKEITDLPVEVLSHIFDYIPLDQVLRSQALVSSLFYEAHRLHCRSTKQLTLIGHYLVKIDSGYDGIVSLPDSNLKEQLFNFARSKGDPSSPAINPSSVHLKLVAGREEAAYASIGKKFKSITHFELYHLAFERHYKHIVKMINAWGSGKRSPNMLTDVKVFFLPELYSATNKTSLSRNNKNACIAYFLEEALNPRKSPALRQLTLDLAIYNVPYFRNSMFCNYNDYIGPSHRNINLSQVMAIKAEYFESYFLQQRKGKPAQFKQLTALREMSICLDWHLKYDKPNNIDKLISILRQLTTLTISTYYCCVLTDCENFAPILATVLATKSSFHSMLTSLTLKKVSVLETNLLAGRTLSPQKTTIFDDDYYETNNHLEHLRVDFFNVSNTQMKKVKKNEEDEEEEEDKEEENLPKTPVRFQALTSLHLVKSNLLHGNKLESAEAAFEFLSMLFPNVVHLRLDGNHYAPGVSYPHTNPVFWHQEIPCKFCRANFLKPSGQMVKLSEAVEFIQNLSSTTGDVCKANLVSRAMTAWPHLATITLQVEDFAHEAEFPGYQEKLKYLFKSETLVIRDALTGELVPEEKREWTLKKVLY